MRNILIFTAHILLFFLMHLDVNAQPNCSNFSTIYTPRGTGVPVYQYYCEPLTPAQLAQALNWVNVNYVNFGLASVVSPATGKYNCHSYAWHNSTTENNIWIDTPGDDAYWLDGSYTYPANQLTATKWSYFNGDHSARVFPAGQSVYVRSKWGQLPLMYHKKDVSPYNAQYPPYNGTTTGYIAFEDCIYSSNTCKAPGVFWTTNITSTKATLNWTRACNASQYQIQYKLPNGSSWSTIWAGSVPNPHFVISLNVSGMSPNTCYNFRVKVVNGTGSAYSTVETVCTNASGQPYEGEDKFGGMPVLFAGEVDISVTTDVVEADQRSSRSTCQALVSGSDISVINIDFESEYILCNALGQILCQGKAIDGTIQCRTDTPGIYFLSIVDGSGNKCAQKVFVN